MTASLLNWYALHRESVPGVLLGTEAITEPAGHTSQAPVDQSADLMVGITAASPQVSATPCVALVADGHVGDLFAWLHTYSNESFPISQFCRIETTGRWNSLLKLDGLDIDFQSAAWASAIAGEMLANAEQSIEPKAVPLSWAAGCFSYTMARTFRVAGRQMEASRDVAARLRVIESDSRFARRKVSVDMLSSVWAIAASQVRNDNDDVHDVVAAVLSALDREGELGRLRDNDKLMSSSAEQRIHGYDEFVDGVLASQQRLSRPKNAGVGAFLAGAALIAGGGTSHVDLLKPYIDDHPDSLPWFGLLAGLAGPRVWDSDWLRLVKGIERQIRGGFQLTDPLQSDLCWVEFDWLRQLSKSPSVFIDLPKYHNRLLTVEIFPGATYQARLVGPTSDGRGPAKQEPKAEPTLAYPMGDRLAEPNIDSSDALAQLSAVSRQLQVLVDRLTDGTSVLLTSGQRALFEDPVPGRASKRSGGRAKKSSTGN
jgi:hypothetical protein